MGLKGYAELVEQLCDLDDRRIAAMDAAGIDVQVLSLTSPGVEQLNATEAVTLAREANDRLADAVRGHPNRFVGFAALPTAAPGTAADELERMVREHGFKGALINGHTRGRYLDDKFFDMNFTAHGSGTVAQVVRHHATDRHPPSSNLFLVLS